MSNSLFNVPESNMPGFLKANLSLTQAQQLLTKFPSISIDEILGNQSSTTTTPRLFRVTATVLYATQPSKKISFAKTKGYAQARKLEIEKYHRFVVFGIPGTATVIALFTSNSEESRRLFRYKEGLKPGQQVEVIKPVVEGQLSKGGTALITTKEPLVPSPHIKEDVTLPPYDVEGTALDYKFFSFVTKNLHVDSAVIADKVCPGTICDGQTYHEACACLETSNSAKTWNLLLDFTCPELNSNVNNGDMLQLYSNHTATVFLTPAVINMDPDSDKIDRFDLDDQVQTMVGAINGAGGFRISGWFKPASDEEGTAVEHKKFHVCMLQPAVPLTNEQVQLKYNGISEEATN